MKRYLQSQTGAALILVLFVVLFLSVVGALLLNLTTYSKKSIVNNFDEEKEFYLAEGALSLALEDIIGSSHLVNEIKDYNIDGETISVTREISGDFIILSAKYKDVNKHNITREVTIRPIYDTSYAILYGEINTDIHVKGGRTENVDTEIKNIYTVLKDFYTKDKKKYTDNFELNGKSINDTDKLGSKQIFRYKNSLKLDGEIIVRANDILIIEGNLTLKGSAPKITIEKGGVLIVNNLIVNNSIDETNIIKGALVAKKISKGSNGNNKTHVLNVNIGASAGLPCNLLEELVDYIFDNIQDLKVLGFLGLSSINELLDLLGINSIFELLGFSKNNTKDTIKSLLYELGLSGCGSGSGSTIEGYEVINYKTYH